MTDKKKATLVLGGGSAIGLAHIGVLSVLEAQAVRVLESSIYCG